MDDVIFARNPRLLDVAAQLKRSVLGALGLAVNYAQLYQLQTNDARTFRAIKVTSQVATRGKVCGL